MLLLNSEIGVVIPKTRKKRTFHLPVIPFRKPAVF